MKIQYCLLLFLLLLGFTQCKSPAAKEDRLSDDALMDTVQRRTFNYFWEGAEPNSGLLVPSPTADWHANASTWTVSIRRTTRT